MSLKKNRRRASILIGLLVLFVIGLGQGLVFEAQAEKTITKIAVVAPEEGNDYGWNQEGVESAKDVAKWLGAEIEVADGAGYGDIGPILRDLAEGGAQWIIAWASGYNTVAPQIAQQTGVPVLVIGAFEQGLIPGLSTDIETRAEQGSFLAGVLAAKMTHSGTLGICISADDENWVKMAGGFAAGAKRADPGIKILMAQIGQAGYADAAGGSRVTKNLISGGADIIFGMGDGSTFGMIQAVETATPPKGAEKVWFIDVIGDKTSLDKKGIYLTSVVWDYLPMFKKAAQNLKNGTYGRKILWIDVRNGCIKLLKTKHIPDEVWSEVQAMRADIVAGKIEVPVLRRKKEVQSLIK
ncbi:MAG: BMP family ABC transporter substrate-binding protein [Deltaproteobacteria bacterium]|nr:BMP family ABC transporter substrate-binding protein [Deltaproteobacteria bacterium]